MRQGSDGPRDLLLVALLTKSMLFIILSTLHEKELIVLWISSLVPLCQSLLYLYSGWFFVILFPESGLKGFEP